MGVYHGDTTENNKQKEKSYTGPQKRNDYSFPSTDNGLLKSNGGSQKTTEHLQENANLELSTQQNVPFKNKDGVKVSSDKT